MKYWLLKSEPSEYSIDDLKRDKITNWHGVRNYQARNFLKEMKKGEKILFYHSVNEPVGVAGLAEVEKIAYPDPSQFDKKSGYYDDKSRKDMPRWFSPDIKLVSKFKNIITLAELKKDSRLKGMLLFQKGSRLSVQPVGEAEFKIILKIANGKE
jgi:predicted RNA-binding protein with PUA-like domain